MDNVYADSDTSITDVSQIIDVFNTPDQGLDDGNSEEARIGFKCGTVRNSKVPRKLVRLFTITCAFGVFPQEVLPK